MAFDIKTAKPVSGFDISTAKPVKQSIIKTARKIFESGIDNGEIQPITSADIIGGIAPYKAADILRRGIIREVIPEGIGRTATEMITDPSLLAGGEGIISAGKTIIPKTGSKIAQVARSVLGGNTKAVKWISKRGAKEVFTPEKQSIDFIRTTLAPKVQKEVEMATTGAIKKAGKVFDKAESLIPKNEIALNKTFNNAREILSNYGLLEVNGRVSQKAFSEEVPRAIKVIASMYEEALPATGKISGVGPIANKSYFRFYRNMLRGVQQNAEGFSKDIQHVVEGLYDDMERAGATGIKKAKDLFRKASQFEEEFGMTPEKVSSRLKAAVNPENTTEVKRQLKSILGKKADDIINQVVDHRVAQEFVTKSKGISKTNILQRAGKKLLKDVYMQKY